MKKVGIFFFFIFIASAQIRYLDTVFVNYIVHKDILYGIDTTFTGAIDSLKMDIYSADGDVVTERPVLVFAHGGTFISGSKNDSDVVAMCKAFVHRGYVTVSINYRLGFNLSSYPAMLQKEAIKALLRAVQDGKGALRYLYKTAKDQGNPYKIDTNLIFFVGVSAGGFIGNHIAYMKTLTELNQYTSDTLLAEVGGGLEGRLNPGYSYNLKAMVNLCGAVGLSSWIDPNEIPLISMHGTADQTVPYGQGSVLNILPVHGSFSMDSVADLRGVPSALFTWDSLGHVPFQGSNPDNLHYMRQTIDWIAKNLYSLMSQGTLLPDTTVQPYVSSLQTLLPLHEVRVFPNPVQENLYLSISNPVLRSLNVEIYNLIGQNVYSNSFPIKNHKLQINLSHLNQGAYFIRLTDNRGRQRIEKLLIK